ncbi:MAG TPA: mandelate racemase/muconate lactonizing enzyme family protein [Bryobacteraceae bacterium]|nr:mandelate racemase/muconate lactonizing enzyme family protein [Bryobacteraceae bacterium]
MKITNVSTAVLEANFDWTFVKVETDENITGYGEAFLGPGLPEIIQEFATILIGEDPASIDRINRRMRSSSIHASPGVVQHAFCGIETALLDAVGKRHGLPIWQLLGGKYRDSVTIYADCHAGDALESITCLLVPRTPHWMQGAEGAPRERSIVSLKHHGWDASKDERLTEDSYAARAQEMVHRGFSILKFDVDVPTPYETDEYNRDLSRVEIEYAASLVGAVRKAVGPEVGLAIDCHWNYGVRAAVEMARAMEPFHLLWLEDPVPPENIRAIGEVQRNTATTIATGENHYHRIDFQRLIMEGGLRLLAPDVQKIGLWEGRKVADLAEMHYVNLSLHNISSPIGTMGGVHLCAAAPNILALEWHAASVPFFDELVKDAKGPLIENGKIKVPEGPGLGVELDELAAYRYRKPGTRFFGN